MGNFTAILHSLEAGFPIWIGHLSLTIALWIVAVLIDYWLTPYHKVDEIRTGNIAVALSAGGSALAIAIPLAFCLAGSVGAWDILIWAIPVLAFQILAFWVIQLLIHDLGLRLESHDIASALFLVLVRLGVAVINAAAIAS